MCLRDYLYQKHYLLGLLRFLRDLRDIVPAGPKKLCPAGILLITGIIGPPAFGMLAIDPEEVLPADAISCNISDIFIALSPFGSGGP